MIDGAAIVAAARSHLGTPWMHQARLPGHGMDCIGLVICVAREVGAVPAGFDVGGYSRSPNGSMMRLCSQHMDQIDAPELGAVVVIATQADPHHIGIIGDHRHGGWSLIHASNAARPAQVIETRLMWTAALQCHGIFRFRAH